MQESIQLRLDAVLRHIEAHIDEPLGLDALARVALCSPFHFHRLFAAHVGVTSGRFVQLLRLRRASYQLAFRPRLRILDIALEAGFASQEAFARAFRKAFGQTPSAFRRQPDWEPWQETLEPTERRGTFDMNTRTQDDVRIIDFPETRIACLSHRGKPERVMESVQAFIRWRKANGPSPRDSRTFNIFHTDPETAAPDEYRMDIAVSLRTRLAANDAGIHETVIPAGRCAVLRYTGPDRGLRDAIAWLYRDWLSTSGENLRDFPIFVERVTLFPDVKERDMITDIHLPLA